MLSHRLRASCSGLPVEYVGVNGTSKSNVTTGSFTYTISGNPNRIMLFAVGGAADTAHTVTYNGATATRIAYGTNNRADIALHILYEYQLSSAGTYTATVTGVDGGKWGFAGFEFYNVNQSVDVASSCVVANYVTPPIVYSSPPSNDYYLCEILGWRSGGGASTITYGSGQIINQSYTATGGSEGGGLVISAKHNSNSISVTSSETEAKTIVFILQGA